MRVLLVMPPNCDVIHSISLPLGILSIASYLKQHGIEVQICDLSVKRKSLGKVLDSFRPDVVGLSFASAKSIDGIIMASEKIRERGIPVVWGGAFCDLAEPAHLFGTGLVDIVSYKEGEETWLELIRTFERSGDLSEVKGIAFLKNGEIIRTADRPFMDPKELPRLDFSLIDVPLYFQYLYGCKKLLYVYLSKGCPAKCTFCYNPISHCSLRKKRDLSVFMDEITELVADYGTDGLYFCDELAFVNDEELLTVCDAFQNSGLSFHWGFQNRIGALSRDALKKAYETGCRWVNFGVESGNREILRQVHKEIPYDLIEPTFAMCAEIGFISLANFMIGFPDETCDQLRETVDLALRLQSTQNSFFKYVAAPNLLDGQIRREQGRPYPSYKDLRDYRRMDFFSDRRNCSRIPQKELDVVQSHFLWKAIFRKDYGDARQYDLLLKSVLTFLRRLRTLNNRFAVKAVKEIVSDFLRFFFDEFFYPSIHKKYDLK